MTENNKTPNFRSILAYSHPFILRLTAGMIIAVSALLIIVILILTVKMFI